MTIEERLTLLEQQLLNLQQQVSVTASHAELVKIVSTLGAQIAEIKKDVETLKNVILGRT
ncbi:MAG TPA: hypothetical protein P5539_08915 [Mesotoga sp.]|nr:hypothetical protein [Mesotoga sp.]